MNKGLSLLVALLFTLTLARPASADWITTTLDGCVSLDDIRLVDAKWFAEYTFQAVAFDDDEAGCATTIQHPVLDVYEFVDDRDNNTLLAFLDLEKLPTCGRRQYDLHLYFEGGVLDPMGLKSLVIDTGVDCFVRPPPDTPPNGVPEPAALLLLFVGLLSVKSVFRNLVFGKGAGGTSLKGR
jgi:hypothetical protein